MTVDLIENGDFSNGTNSWSLQPGATLTSGGGSISFTMPSGLSYSEFIFQVTQDDILLNVQYTLEFTISNWDDTNNSGGPAYIRPLVMGPNPGPG